MFGSRLVLEILLIFSLIVLNGLFAMSEMAVVSSRRSRLQQRADTGDHGARRAIELVEQPNRFLSTVQIGITLIGVFAGAYGGASIAGQLDAYLESFPAIGRYSEEIALAAVVAAITFLSLVIGELVPKRIALTHPERIASLVARPMQRLSIVASPLVRLLSLTTDAILRLLRVRRSAEPPVTEEEVSALLKVGLKAGVFEEEEHDLVERIFWLGDQRASTLMTPRHRVQWLDTNASSDEQRAELIRNRFSHYLVCDGAIDEVLGMVRGKDLLAQLLEAGPLDLKAVLRNPLFVPEGLRALRLLDMFRETGVHVAVVIDEYGGVDGIITLNDVLESLAGDPSIQTDPRVVRRPDGSWLLDASLAMDEFWAALAMEERRDEQRGPYHTLGGLVLTELGRIPRSGDSFRLGELEIEVVDMDGHRVDKVLVSRVPTEPVERLEAE